MKMYKRLGRLIVPVVLFLTTISISAQVDKEPPSRSITSQDFQDKRPATIRGSRTKTSSKKPITPVSNQKRRKNIAVVTNPGRRYKFIKRTMIPKTALPSATNSISAEKKTKKTISQPEEIRWQDEELGVTFWKLRPLKKDEEEDAPTFEVDTGDGIDKWTAERVRSTTKFKSGDRVRFTIEPLRSGYLYIINREAYDDGTSGEAELIYPEMRVRSRKDNRVTAGRLVDVPSLLEEKPYFKISPKKDYIGEEIIVIISPTQLTGFNISAEAQSVRRELLQNWLNEWNSVMDIYDASDGEGVAYTRTEEESVRTRSLTQEEPLPQTIYRFKSRVGKPLMISFQIQVR